MHVLRSHTEDVSSKMSVQSGRGLSTVRARSRATTVESGPAHGFSSVHSRADGRCV